MALELGDELSELDINPLMVLPAGRGRWPWTPSPSAADRPVHQGCAPDPGVRGRAPGNGAAPTPEPEFTMTRTPEDEVLHRIDNGVAWITLNRPEAMNAITWDQRERVIALLAEASADPGVRAVVVTATGKGFCAGADLRGGGTPRVSASPATSPA